MSPATGSAATTVAAVDLGAGSGRVVAAAFDGERLRTRTVHRFEHAPRTVDGVLRWDVATLWAGVREGLAALTAADGVPASVGVDGWGVDHALLRADGTLAAEPACYRDPRRSAAVDRAVAEVGRERLYAATGTQVAPISTLFALLADARGSAAERERLRDAAQLVMLPDLFHHLLRGAPPVPVVTERTAASTSALLDVTTGTWVRDLLEELGVPAHLLPEVVPAGTDTGPVGGGTGGDLAGLLRGTRVVLPAAHDTASAVAATPGVEDGALFLSCGTWSLLGTERRDALVGPAARDAELTHEAGYGGTVLLLRNLTGDWLLQECRRTWAREGLHLSAADLAALAAAEPPLRSLVDPGDPGFLAPGDVPARLRAACARHGEPVPATPGALARCVVDSLALAHRDAAAALERVTGQRAPSITVTGGGSQHELLVRATADATGLPVRLGPVEATATGNAGAQLVARGELAGPADVRRLVAADPRCHRVVEPAAGSAERWGDAAQRWRRLARRTAGATGGTRQVPA
ncbi:rhamnulokinase [Kineococcus sp. SYSU DK004]|uniref:rhamnulokinase n=1 Tax=Kineococcus sp. SYSU DK004 TaxID=3383125 RepID=UPI003D7CA455